MDVLELLLNAAPAKLPEKDYKIKRLSKEYGGDVVFKLRALPFSRVAEIRRVDAEDTAIHIVLAGVVSPDIRSQALLQKYGAATPAELLRDVQFLLPGEVDDLALRIEQLSGYKMTVTEEVKKNSGATGNTR